jgi:hypothetical protein
LLPNHGQMAHSSWKKYGKRSARCAENGSTYRGMAEKYTCL